MYGSSTVYEVALPIKGELDKAPLENCWSAIKATITNRAESVVGYVERRTCNDWFEEKCRQGAARVAMLQ